MLQKRIAGVPAWGWALVIGGAIVAYAYLTRRQESPTPAPAAFSYPDDTAPSDAGDVPGTVTPSGNTITLTTNPAWVRYVTDLLVAEGLYGAVEVGNALTKALAGIDLTAQEGAIWNIAVRRFGAPPEGNPPIVIIPTPGPPPPPPPGDTTKPPPAPTGLRVLSPSRTQMTIGWNPVPGATAYQVAVTSRADYHEWTSNLNVSRGYTILGLKPGLDLRIQVRARNSAGVGPWSAPMNTRTPR